MVQAPLPAEEPVKFDTQARPGICLCGGPATIYDTRAKDKRLNFRCHKLSGVGHPIHYGFVSVDAYEDLGQEAYAGTSRAGSSLERAPTS